MLVKRLTTIQVVPMEWVVMGLTISRRSVWERRPHYPNLKTVLAGDITQLGQESMTSWELVQLGPSHKTQSLDHSKKIHEIWPKWTGVRRGPGTASEQNVNMEFHFLKISFFRSTI